MSFTNQKYNFVKWGFLLLILLIYSISFHNFEAPFRRMNYDSYTQIAHQVIWQDTVYDPDLFPGIFTTDIRTNYYNQFINTGAETLGLTARNSLYLLGITNIIILFLATYSLVKKTVANHKMTMLSIFLIFFGIATTWELYGPAYSVISFSDLIINAFYPQVLGFGIVLILVNISLNNNIKRKDILTSFFLQFLLTFLHLFSAGLSIITIGVLEFSSKKTFKFWEYKKTLLLLFASFASLLIPGYNWVEYVFSSTSNLQSSPIASGIANPEYYSISFRLAMVGVTIIGLVGILIKNKQLFVKLWALAFGFVSLSFVLPFTLPYFWRFMAFMRYPVNILFVDVINKVRFKKIIIIGLIIFTITNSGLLILRNTTTYNDTVGLEIIDNISNSTILADQVQSNYIQSKNMNQVYFIPNGHITDPKLLSVNVERLNLVKEWYNGRIKSLEELNNIKEIDYILINKFSSEYDYKTIFLNTKLTIIDENFKYILAKTK